MESFWQKRIISIMKLLSFIFILKCLAQINIFISLKFFQPNFYQTKSFG